MVLGGAGYAWVGAEKAFYFWDWAGYPLVAQDVADALARSPSEAWAQVMASLRGDYARYYAVPLAPLLAWVEGGRAAYVAAVAALYLTAFALAAAWLMARLFPWLGRRGFWAVACAVPLVPPAWGVVVRGYPDPLAAAFATLALLVAVCDPGFRRWRTPLLAGVCLAVAILLRRHLAYFAIAEHLAAGLVVLSVGWRDGLRRLLRAGARLAVLPLVMLATLHLGNPHFIPKVLAVDYGALYASYQLSIWAMAGFFGLLAGWSLLAPALVGLGFCAWRDRSPGRLLMLATLGLWSVMWIVQVRQKGDHQLLTVVVLALVFGGLRLIEAAAPGRRRMAAAGLAAVLVANAVWSFVPFGVQGDGYAAEPGWRRVFARPYPPLRREDYAEVARLADVLRRDYSDWRAIYTAAASRDLNFDLLQKAGPALHPGGPHSLLVPPVPEIDSRDPLPVEELMRAEVIVAATPPQYSLWPEAHDLIRVVLTGLEEGWPVLDDFRRRPETFSLRGGVTVSLWERGRPSTLEDAAALLDRLRPEVTETAAFYRQYWVVTPPRIGHVLSWRPDGSRGVQLWTLPGPGDEAVRLAPVAPPPGPLRAVAEARVSGDGCRGVRVGSTVLLPGEGVLDVSVQDALVVRKTDPEGTCHLHLRGLDLR